MTDFKRIRPLGGKRAKIAVMTVATDSPEEVGAEYIEVFEKIGVKQAQMIDVSNRADAAAEENLEAVREASGLFFTGGDQLHILCEGERFNLPERQMIFPKEEQHKAKRAGANENV